MNIIDMHIHPYKNDAQNIAVFGTPESKPETLVTELKRAGITHCCGSVLETLDGSSWADVKRLNDDALEFKKLYGDFYTPGFHVHPNFVRESCEEIERMDKLGVRFIGELCPYLLGWKGYTSREMTEIFELAQEKNMTVSIHPSTPDDLDAFVARFPKLDIILAHPGDHSVFRVNLERMKKYENLCQDLSGTGIFRYGAIRYGIDQVGKERFLFGSDFPICNPGMYVQGTLFEPLTDTEIEYIMEKNSQRLILDKQG